ncbi:MAG: NUDIX hydrolase [Candidatus Sumerlaeaceae bacterium]|nr:NUDIX hydrolase [Candidatus Sumerlaeaceae bacterium]
MERNQELLEALRRFRPYDEAEARDCETIIQFVMSHDHPFDRAHLQAHLTASSLVVDGTGTRALFGFHRKLERWLQLGGHGEPGDRTALDAALREAREESGIAEIRPHPEAQGLVDLDVHLIPARGEVPAHNHLDLRYILLAPDGLEPIHREDEHGEVRWFAWDEALGLKLDPSLRRFIGKARELVLRRD